MKYVTMAVLAISLLFASCTKDEGECYECTVYEAWEYQKGCTDMDNTQVKSYEEICGSQEKMVFIESVNNSNYYDGYCGQVRYHTYAKCALKNNN